MPHSLPPRRSARGSSTAEAPTLAAALTVTIALALSLGLGSCSLFIREPRAVVVLDEAFAEARPLLAERLQARRTFGIGPGRLLSPALVRTLSLSEGAGKAVEEARSAEKRGVARVVLVTSPLVARSIVAGGSWSGEPPLLVPEYRGSEKELPGLFTAVTDPVPAYREAGKAAGIYMAELAKAGLSPSCGLLFSESPARPRAALEAFAVAYAAASEGRPLAVRELPGQDAAADGSKAGTAESDAEAAVAELLGSDLRLLFVAIGPGSIAALKKAASPGLALGIDSPAPVDAAGLAFRITPDEDGLARALAEERMDAGKDAKPGGEARAVPALLVPEPGARAIRAGRQSLFRLLEAATLGAKERR